MVDVPLLHLDPCSCRALADLPPAAVTQPGPVFCEGQVKKGQDRSDLSQARLVEVMHRMDHHAK